MSPREGSQTATALTLCARLSAPVTLAVQTQIWSRARNAFHFKHFPWRQRSSGAKSFALGASLRVRHSPNVGGGNGLPGKGLALLAHGVHGVPSTVVHTPRPKTTGFMDFRWDLSLH